MNLTTEEKIDLAMDDNTSSEVLKELSKDPNRMVRTYITWHPNTPVETLRTLATDKDPSVRANVSLNSNTPPDVLEDLENDSHPIVSKFLKDPKRLELIEKFHTR